MRTLSAWLCPLILLGALLCSTQRVLSRSGNEISRWALIEALVDRGRTTIENNSFGPTGDTVAIGGRLYSNKPPFLSCWGAAGYWALKNTMGWGLARERGKVVYAVTLWTIGSWTLAFYFLLAWFYAQDPRIPSRLGPWLALGMVLGTTLFSFSGTMNNHTPAAFALLGAALAARRERPLLCGLAIGLCLLFDPVFGGLFGLALLLHWAKNREKAAAFALGAAPLAVLWAFLNWRMTGFPLPLYLYPVGKGVEKAWGESGVIPPRGWDYPLQALLGYRGFFLYSPILLLALAEPALLKRHARGLGFWLIAAAAAATIFHLGFAGGYGGWAFGYRYLIPLVGVFALALPALWGKHRRLAAGLMALGVPMSLLGAYCPWPPSYQGPGVGSPVFEKIRFNAGSNLACFAGEYRLPGAESLAGVFIDDDPYAALWYKINFFRIAGKNAESERLLREGLTRYPDDPALKKRLALDLDR